MPSHRLDVVAPEDVAEEIARAHGYDRIPGRLPAAALPPYRPDPSEPRHRVRRILAGLGLDEVVLHALIGPEDLPRSGYDAEDAEPGARWRTRWREQHSIMRPAMYPSMLAALAENVRQRRLDPWLFEVGKTYWMGDAKGPAWAETRRQRALGGVARRHRRCSAARTAAPARRRAARTADVADAQGHRGGAARARSARHPPIYRPETAEELHPHLHPGRAAAWSTAGGRAYGSLGEVHPRVAEAWDLPGRPVIAAINLGQLFELWCRPRCTVVPVPAAQPIDRDLAVSVEEATPLGELLRILRSSAGPMLVDARVFDVYRGTQVGRGARLVRDRAALPARDGR